MKIIIDRDGKSKGFSFIGFENENSAIRAFSELDN